MHHEDRLIELETRLAHQDQAMLKLSDEVYQQQKQIAALEACCRQLLERLEQFTMSERAASPPDEVPPHY